MRKRQNGDGTGELERLGPDGEDILVLGVEAPGFDALTLREKTLAYHLYRAALPGNRIAFRQSHRDAYEIKLLLEAIFLHAHGLEPALRAAVHEYLKYVWIHHGQYDHHTHTKFAPGALTREGLRDACEHAARAGAPLPLRPGEAAVAMLARLDRAIFDPDHEPVQTNQAEGEDIIATSAVNYWDPGVTAADLDALPAEWRSRLNVRFARVDGRVVPEIYRIGGLYGDELAAASHFLAQALAHAEPGEQRASIESLLAYYRSGDEEDFRRHMVHWLRSDARVDFLNGFIEVYLDPRGAIGQFEANASFRVAGGLIDRVAENAAYFERRMPWDDAYKRDEVAAPVARLATVLVETGDAGPVSPAAYNLPNYNDIRRDHGSKNVILENIENTWSQALEEATVGEFFLAEYREPTLRYFRPLVRPLMVYMHEIIGHGSGRPAPDLAGDPRVLLGRTYSTLEECRADLVALWHIADPKLVEIGAFRMAEQRAVVEVAYASYLQG
ncbi:MAG: dipeptidyl peptidase 3, partial [Candidatus Krumholzibacteria bacterium]|nr:dipeptidyl peptidase 3 [Candidatus Krumholzibacteria bacterium]